MISLRIIIPYLNEYYHLNNTEKAKQNIHMRNYKYKIIEFLLILLVLIITLMKIFKRNILNKVCLCTIAKEENRYIKEFIEHYKNYDIDKIYLYDNNDINGEKLEDVINDYIKSGLVELIDYKGFKQPQLKAYNDCYKRYNNLYDWLIFYDVDEYIYLKDFKSIKSFLNDKRFEKCNRDYAYR